MVSQIKSWYTNKSINLKGVRGRTQNHKQCLIGSRRLNPRTFISRIKHLASKLNELLIDQRCRDPIRVSRFVCSVKEESLCGASEAVEPVRFWIYSPTLIPETVTPITLPLCSWSLSMHDRGWELEFINLQTEPKSHTDAHIHAYSHEGATSMTRTHTIQSF